MLHVGVHPGVLGGAAVDATSAGAGSVSGPVWAGLRQGTACMAAAS